MKGAVVYSILFVLFLPMKRASPERTEGDVYLDAIEDQVTRLQQQVVSNHNRQCDLLASCVAPGNCARSTCWPLVGDVQRTTCQKVQNNSYCAGPATGACPSKKFDYTKPYVRVAPTTNPSAPETATTICAQRELSIVFKDICNSTSHSRAFFGSVDGTYMQFPGSDQNETDCKKYDPRLRPWYSTSASVTKAVMVLLDVGQSMGNGVLSPLEGTIFDNTKAIVLALLHTLSSQDYINIITFNSVTATSLWPSPVKVLLNDSGISESPDFDGLVANLSHLQNGNLESLQRPSNISLGIAEAIRNYNPPGFPEALEIIVAFTDGDVRNLKDGALAALQGRNRTKVFIFKLPQSGDANEFLIGTPFITQLHNIGGSFNVVTTTEKLNPLLITLPYFSFLANFRAKINPSPDYSSIYEDIERVANNVFSITKPAFDADGNLLGVGGVNIFVEELGNRTDLVYKAMQSRNTSKKVDSTKVVLTTADARIQSDSPGPSCPNSITPENMGLCSRTDTKSTIQNLACCDACSSHTPPNTTPRNAAIGACLGVLALAAFVCVLLYCRWQRRKQPPLDVYPGLHDPANQSSQNRDQDY